MRRWSVDALLIAVPCCFALLVYDWLAVVVFGHQLSRLVPWHDFARGMMQDLGLTAAYTLTVTPRVSGIVAAYPDRARRSCLIMLGLGLAWYEVTCAWVTRVLDAPPDRCLEPDRVVCHSCALGAMVCTLAQRMGAREKVRVQSAERLWGSLPQFRCILSL